MGKEPFSESQKLKFAKTFFSGKSLVADLANIHTKYCICILLVVWKHPVAIFGPTQFQFTLEWTYATVVSVDVSLVVRISEDACPSVH